MSTQGEDLRHALGRKYHFAVGLKGFLGLFLIIFVPAATVMVGSYLAGCPDAVDHALPMLGAGFVFFSALAACGVQRDT